MTELRTDEEQAEMLKRWWNEHGKSTLVSIIVVAGGWMGWNFYQDQQQTTGETASALYTTMTEKAAAAITTHDEAAQQEAVVLAEKLKNDFSGSSYSQFASLFLARLVDSAEAPVKYLATARLADVLVELNDPDAALALVNEVPDPAYAPQYLEARGDALFRKGDKAAARTAYLEALDAASELGVDTQLLQRKADFLIAAEDA